MSDITVTLCLFICKKEKQQQQHKTKQNKKKTFYFTETLFSQHCVVCESVKNVINVVVYYPLHLDWTPKSTMTITSMASSDRLFTLLTVYIYSS